MSVITGQRPAGSAPGSAADADLLRPSIPSVYPAQLVLLAEHFGVARERLLADTGIERDVLERPDALIAPASSIALTRRALELTGEPGLGFYYGLQLKLSSHGSVGMLAMTSATL